MNRVIGRQSAWRWAAVIASAPLLANLWAAMWRTPYPISEAVAIIEDSWPSGIPIVAALVPGRSWYRPLFFMTWTALLKWTGSLAAALALFRVIEVGSAVALGVLFLWWLRPRSAIDAAAAVFALAVLIGMPGFRDNLEIPLLYTLIGMPILLLVFVLLEREHRWWHAPVFVLLLLIAAGFKEQGLIVAPVVVVAWWMGAPGIRRAGVAAVVAATLAYLTVRATAGQPWPAFVQDVGFGFQILSPDQALTRFGPHPWPMYAYNVAATISNLLISEPTTGMFTVVQHLKDGTVSPWEVNQVLSSAALTVVVAWWGISVLRRDAAHRWSADSRLFGLLVIAIAASGALGFNYTRDRLGGMAVVFFALAAFEAVRALAQRSTATTRRGAIAIAAFLFVLGTAWQLRAIGTVEHARIIAIKNRREWLTNLQARRIEFARDRSYLRVLNGMVTQATDSVPPEPSALPSWASNLIGGS